MDFSGIVLFLLFMVVWESILCILIYYYSFQTVKENV